MLIRIIAGLLCASAIWAQNIETLPFRSVLASGGQTPAGNAPASTATLLIHTVRGNSGQVESATVEVRLNLLTAQAAGITSVRIREGAVGSNGAVVIETGLSSTDAVPAGTGTSTVENQTSFVAGEPGADTGLQAIRGILANPGRYYLDVQSSGSPLQGELQRAQKVVLLGQMRPENEVPAQQDQPNAFAVGTIIAYATRDASGALSSGEVFFDVDYNLNRPATLTGLHIHTGDAGVAGPVTIGTPISASNPVSVPAPGIGNFRSRVEVNVSNAASRDALAGLFARPAGYYLNLHTSELPGGIVRAPLRNTDRTVIETMLTGTVSGIPPVPAALTVYTIRGGDGTVQAGVAEISVAPRVSAPTVFTGLALQTGAPGRTRPSIDSRISQTNPVTLRSGGGVISRFVTVSSVLGTGDLDFILSNPDLYTLTLTPAAGASAAFSSPLAIPNMGAPQISAVISAVSDPGLTTVAAGGLATVYGINFARLTQDLRSMEGSYVPWTLAGVGVSVGGIRAPMLMVSPTFAVIQVPFEVPPGQRPVRVVTSAGASNPVNATVAAVAPALYFGSEGGTAIHLDYSLVSPQHPAQPNELVWFFATGLGQTASGEALLTGAIPAYRNGTSTARVTATIGARAVEVLDSLPSPGYVGLYQVLVRIPADARSGDQPAMISIGGASSNVVNVRIR
ncbi:MAG: CHRD domain-containing protein [Bryobacteraceae bacterium]|nr:CHRD domain-containing protein [Bryobacteraceae bacterium]